MRRNQLWGRLIGLLFFHHTVLCFSDQPEYEISDSDVSYLFTNKYTKVFSYSFNSCMFQVENNNTEYHTCDSFSSEVECQCEFLKKVSDSCSTIAETETNIWYLAEEISKYCRPLIDSPLSRNNIDRRGFDDGPDRFMTDKYSEYTKPVKVASNDRQRQLDVDSNKQIHGMAANLQQRYGQDLLATMDFEQYYNKKHPSAMTVDYKLISMLGLTATPTNLYMTKYTTTMAVESASKTHHTQLEVIRVLENDQTQSNHKREVVILRPNATSRGVRSEPSSVASISRASTLNSNGYLLTLFSSVSLILLVWPFATTEEDIHLSQPSASTKSPQASSKKRIRSAAKSDSSNKRVCSK